jgi:septum formation protein
MIILASSSLRRRELLKRAGIEFKSIKPTVEEKMEKKEKIESFVERIALEKALDAEEKINFVRGTDILIGVDTVGIHKNKILTKPRDEADAKKVLRALSGKTHTVISGVALKKGDKIVTFHEKTKITFRKISLKEIDDYVRTGEPLDKAAAYAIQGRASLFISKIEGDFFNVVGIPLYRLGQELQKL